MIWALFGVIVVVALLAGVVAAFTPRARPRTAVWIIWALQRAWPAGHRRRERMEEDAEWFERDQKMTFVRTTLRGLEVPAGLWCRLGRTSWRLRIITVAVVLSLASMQIRPSVGVGAAAVIAGDAYLAISIQRNWRQWLWSERLKRIGWVPLAAWMLVMMGDAVITPIDPSRSAATSTTAGMWAFSVGDWICVGVMGFVLLAQAASAIAKYLEDTSEAATKAAAGGPYRRPVFSPAVAGIGTFIVLEILAVATVQYLVDHWTVKSPGAAASPEQVQAYQQAALTQIGVCAVLVLAPFAIGALVGGVLAWVGRRADREYEWQKSLAKKRRAGGTELSGNLMSREESWSAR